MSLTKLLKFSSNFFKKDVITFLIIRRHDLGETQELLRYVSVRPNSSTAIIRKKMWFLLDLPDFCEERIVLSRNGAELPLTVLLKGNSPQHPYDLDVWPSSKQMTDLTPRSPNNMLTMGDPTIDNAGTKTDTTEKEKIEQENEYKNSVKTASLCLDNFAKLRYEGKTKFDCLQSTDYLDTKHSELSFIKSTTSFALKMHGRKGRDNITNVLYKIQSDLNSLSNKLNYLEQKIPHEIRQMK